MVMMSELKVSGRVAYEWVRSVANALFWEDDALWTGKEDVEYGDSSWMEWRSSNTVGAFEERARAFVPPAVYAAFEAWAGEEELDEAPAGEQTTGAIRSATSGSRTPCGATASASTSPARTTCSN